MAETRIRALFHLRRRTLKQTEFNLLPLDMLRTYFNAKFYRLDANVYK